MLLSKIYSEECGHCNFGWRFPKTHRPDDPGLKKRLSAYLRVAFGHLETHELSHLPVEANWPKEGAALGLCNGSDARALFYATVEEIIIPGLQALGIDAQDAWKTRLTAHQEDATPDHHNRN